MVHKNKKTLIKAKQFNHNMAIVGLKYTVQYSTLDETWSNMFLAILVQLAAQDFYLPT